MTFRLLCAHSADTECDARAKVVTAVTMDKGWWRFPKLESADLDLAVPGEAFFEGVLWIWHDALLGCPVWASLATTAGPPAHGFPTFPNDERNNR
jgi:hypothetical protein